MQLLSQRLIMCMRSREEEQMSVMSYIDAINLAMKEEMERDPRVFVLGEDVGRKGGVFKATAGLYEQFGKSVLWIRRLLNLRLLESASERLCTDETNC